MLIWPIKLWPETFTKKNQTWFDDAPFQMSSKNAFKQRLAVENSCQIWPKLANFGHFKDNSTWWHMIGCMLNRSIEVQHFIQIFEFSLHKILLMLIQFLLVNFHRFPSVLSFQLSRLKMLWNSRNVILASFLRVEKWSEALNEIVAQQQCKSVRKHRNS